MSNIKVQVEFIVSDRAKFDKWLHRITSPEFAPDNGSIWATPVIGYRADDYVQRREALTKFVDAMETKLRKNDGKKNWRDQPLQALFKLAMLEVQELIVALEFFSAAEARGECVDVANFFLILYDRLGMLDQDKTAGVKP